MESLKQRHPAVFVKKEGEISGRAATRIAKELAAELPEFTAQAGTWDQDGFLNFDGERPITLYGATNPNEDLSEAAKFYFVALEELRAKAPQRAAFFDALVEAWKAP
ncbi:hypothetical protein [Streptomyces sp. BK340]|uniref:hypothetical protein n=1 Tax=Streptomyces sp. BK340 TaxID=2572903 RepID=UPI0011A26CE6|nr:hypothetical protein [Streptomyces sp. BK340]TVZ76723.1 hypothetical protein FB157_1423 [Streptomyces sp. BK340]